MNDFLASGQTIESLADCRQAGAEAGGCRGSCEDL